MWRRLIAVSMSATIVPISFSFSFCIVGEHTQKYPPLYQILLSISPVFYKLHRESVALHFCILYPCNLSGLCSFLQLAPKSFISAWSLLVHHAPGPPGHVSCWRCWSALYNSHLAVVVDNFNDNICFILFWLLFPSARTLDSLFSPALMGGARQRKYWADFDSVFHLWWKQSAHPLELPAFKD